MKRFLFPAFCTALLSTSAHALVDTDADGLGDIWENLHSFHVGSNPPADQAPASDLDGDGYSNLIESIVGTDPRDNADFPAHGFSHISPVYESGESGFPSVLIDPPLDTLTWPTIPGKSYQATPSEDLANWSEATGAYLGSGTPQTFESEAIYADGTVPQKLFWRVEINDTDSDIDGLTDYEELHIPDPNDPSKTLDPFNPDSDGDGLTDGAEYIPGTNGLAAFTNFLTSDPDSPGLPASLATGLIGKWDFEETYIAASQGPYYTLARYADTAGTNPIVPFFTETKADGMPSKAAGTISAGFGYLCPPRTLLHNRITYSVSMWARLDQGSITASRPLAALFSHHRHLKKPAPYQAQFKIDLNGMWIERLANGTEVLKAGTYTFINYIPGTNTQTNATINFYGIQSAPQPAGTFDDGQYHHFALVRADAGVTLYRDGQLVGANPNAGRAQIEATNETSVGISLGRFYGEPAESGIQEPNAQAAKAGFDRLRIWSRSITAAEALALYRQDADGDGLWDITEERTRKWDDHNGNAIAEPGEFALVANPLHHDPATTDHDADGLTSIDEQNRTLTKIDAKDTDSDGLPDGFEDQYPPLDPLVWNDGSLDPDNDGLTTAQEYAGGVTDPNVADAALYPPTWLSIERSLRYDYDDYGPSQPNAPKKLTTTATWPGAVPTTDDPLTALIPFAQLHASLTQKQPFPATFPTRNISPALRAEGDGGTIPNPPCHHASLTHKRIIVKVAAAATEARAYKAILVTERIIDGILQTPSSEILTLTVPAGQTQSAPYDLVPQFDAGGTGQNGYTEIVRQTVHRIEIVDADGKPAAELRVAKLEHSLNATGTLNIDDDPDHFYVRIRKGEGMREVSVKLATVGNPDATYNDDPTEIDLTEAGDWFVSPSLMLMSDDVDDDFSRNGTGKDDERNDRTHKIQLGGKVSVDSFNINGTERPAGLTTPVPVKKKLSGRIIFFGDTNNFDNQQKMVEYRKIAIERYAQVGITLDFPITTIAEYPAGLDPENVGFLPNGGNQGKNRVNPDIKALYDSAVENQKNADITVMVIRESVEKSAKGYAVIEARTDTPDLAYVGCVVLAMNTIKNANGIFTVGHEIGHVLTDDSHFGEEYPSGITVPLYKITRNLMRDGTSDKNSFRRSKRFVDLQVGKFRADLLKNP